MLFAHKNEIAVFDMIPLEQTLETTKMFQDCSKGINQLRLQSFSLYVLFLR